MSEQAGSMSDKVALVTGATSGIGRATALRLAQAGAKTFISGRSSAALEETAEAIGALDRQVAVHAGDLTDLLPKAKEALRKEPRTRSGDPGAQDQVADKLRAEVEEFFEPAEVTWSGIIVADPAWSDASRASAAVKSCCSFAFAET